MSRLSKDWSVSHASFEDRCMSGSVSPTSVEYMLAEMAGDLTRARCAVEDHSPILSIGRRFREDDRLPIRLRQAELDRFEDRASNQILEKIGERCGRE